MPGRRCTDLGVQEADPINSARPRSDGGQGVWAEKDIYGDNNGGLQ